MHRFLGVGFQDNYMPLGMSQTVEFILDECFCKLYQLQPQPEFDGTRQENKTKKKTKTTSCGEIFFFFLYFIDSKWSK